MASIPQNKVRSRGKIEQHEHEDDANAKRVTPVGLREDGTYAAASFNNNNAQKVAVSERPSEVRDRTAVILTLARTDLVQGVPSVFYTVTPGRILYVLSFQMSALNTSAANGEFDLQDGVIPIVPFLIPSRVTGSSPSAFSITAPVLPEPIPFFTNVSVVQNSGDVEIAGYLIGYEEPI